MNTDVSPSRVGPHHTDSALLGTLLNGLHVIDRLAASPCSLPQMSQELGLTKSVVYRIIRTLEAEGWVERSIGRDTYYLTQHIWSLGAQSFGSVDVRDAFREGITRLVSTYGETVHLATYISGSVTYIAKEDGWQPIRSYTRVGGRAPAYCVATGKALLAHQSEAEIKSILEGNIKQFTKNTITDPNDLTAELAEIRRLGYAVNRGEWRSEVAGIAVPIFSPYPDGPTAVIAALGFSGPRDRVLSVIPKLYESLQDTVKAAGFVGQQVAPRS